MKSEVWEKMRQYLASNPQHLTNENAVRLIKAYHHDRRLEGAMHLDIADDLVNFGFPNSLVRDTVLHLDTPGVAQAPNNAALDATAVALAAERGGSPEDYAQEAAMMDALMNPRAENEMSPFDIPDGDFQTGNLPIKGKVRYTMNVTDFRGIYGSKGT